MNRCSHRIRKQCVMLTNMVLVGKNSLNHSENLGTINIFFYFLLHTYMQINQINPTISSPNTPQLIPSISHILIIRMSYHPLNIIFASPYVSNQKNCRAIVWIHEVDKQLICCPPACVCSVIIQKNHIFTSLWFSIAAELSKEQ